MRARYCGLLLGTLLASVILTGCYSLRRSAGSGQASFKGSRIVDPLDIAVLNGYRIDVVATGLTFPTGVAFDAEGRACVVESGYAYGEVWTQPRLLRLEANGGMTQIAAGETNGPWTGVAFHNGAFYVAEGGEREGGRLLRITPEGKITVFVADLPSLGDHHSDGPVIGPDGWLYFGQGTASNSGVVGEDNAKFGWLKRHPAFHDIPGEDIILTGENFTTSDPIHGKGKAVTGAFLPFGTASTNKQVIRGQVPCSGAIMRVRPEGGPIELVAWGFRNPFGLAFSPNGKLYATDNGFDERGSRPIWGAADVLWAVNRGSWYGWPDFSAGMRVNQKHFKPPGGKEPRFLLASHPNRPPPAAIFPVHSSADGFDFSRNDHFGFVGEAFVALFGDQAPTVGTVLHPVGCKIVRVDLLDGLVEDFAVNKGPENGPASRIGRHGFERPIAARFNPAGDALYVVDFGVLTASKSSTQPRQKTGVLWRITRNQPR
jgi:glucose/arabinose dehydrogenase